MKVQVKADRTSPRFGPGWVEFPLRCIQSQRVVALKREDVPLDFAVMQCRDEMDRIELTRKVYNRYAALMLDHQLVASMRPSR